MSFLSDKYVIIDKAGDMHLGTLSTGSRQMIKVLLLEMMADAIEESGASTSTPDYIKLLKQKVSEL